MNKKAHIFTDEEIKNISELGDVLRRIHTRLITEGWTIKDGVFIDSDGVQHTRLQP